MPIADPNPVYPGSLSVTIGVHESVSVGGDSTRTVLRNKTSAVQSNQSVEVGKNFVLRAGDSVSIVCGAASLTMKKDGSIVIKGKDITIDASGKLTAKSISDVVIKGSKLGSN